MCSDGGDAASAGRDTAAEGALWAMVAVVAPRRVQRWSKVGFQLFLAGGVLSGVVGLFVPIDWCVLVFTFCWFGGVGCWVIWVIVSVVRWLGERRL
jgi:hypothetical protein